MYLPLCACLCYRSVCGGVRVGSVVVVLDWVNKFFRGVGLVSAGVVVVVLVALVVVDDDALLVGASAVGAVSVVAAAVFVVVVFVVVVEVGFVDFAGVRVFLLSHSVVGRKPLGGLLRHIYGTLAFCPPPSQTAEIHLAGRSGRGWIPVSADLSESAVLNPYPTSFPALACAFLALLCLWIFGHTGRPPPPTRYLFLVVHPPP